MLSKTNYAQNYAGIIGLGLFPVGPSYSIIGLGLFPVGPSYKNNSQASNNVAWTQNQVSVKVIMKQLNN